MAKILVRNTGIYLSLAATSLLFGTLENIVGGFTYTKNLHETETMTNIAVASQDTGNPVKVVASLHETETLQNIVRSFT